MALYTYQAFSSDGKKVQGTLDASSRQAVQAQLTRLKLFPISIHLVQDSASAQQSFWTKLFIPRIQLSDKIFFTRQLSVLLRAGIPLFEAIELLLEQTSKSLRIVVSHIRDNIKEGLSLAESLSKYPKIFDATYIQLVRAGEVSGTLEVVLERIKDYLEKSQILRKKIKSMMMLPLIQLTIIGAVVILLLSAVVPKIAQAFSSQNVVLPLPTRILIGLSNLLTTYYWLLIIIGGILGGIFLWWRSTKKGILAIDALVLKLPLFGYLARMQAITQFCRTLGTLLESGVNIAEALTIVCKVVENKILVDTLNKARESIIKQGKITDYLRDTNIFPPVAIYLIHTGEKSGELDAMLLTVANYYETELQEYMDTVSATANAFIPLIMGAIVGFIVLSIGLPMMNLGKLVDKGA